jgi:hypothetical protein
MTFRFLILFDTIQKPAFEQIPNKITLNVLKTFNKYLNFNPKHKLAQRFQEIIQLNGKTSSISSRDVLPLDPSHIKTKIKVLTFHFLGLVLLDARHLVSKIESSRKQQKNNRVKEVLNNQNSSLSLRDSHCWTLAGTEAGH